MTGSVKQHRNPCSGPSPVYQDLSTYHDWPVTKDIAVGAVSQMLLTEVKFTSATQVMFKLATQGGKIRW